MRFRKLTSALLVLLAGSNIRAEEKTNALEKTKAFPEHQCRYTLPGGNWSWLEKSPAMHSVCVAGDGGGLVFMLLVLPAPDGAGIDADFAAVADEAAGVTTRRGTVMTKRRGSFLLFKGLPCYEYRGILEGHTTVVRFVRANGRTYQLQLVGGDDPVEARPDFEAIMNGFEFTAPPVPPGARKKDPGSLVGKVLGYGLLGGLFLGFLYKAARGEWVRPKEVRKVGPGTTPGSRR